MQQMHQKQSKKLYVGNLPYTVTSDQLTELFEEYGNVVQAKVVIDRFTNRSKGFGFVEFDNIEEAKKAITGMNGKEVQGRTLVVTEARGDERPFNREGRGNDNQGERRSSRPPSSNRFPR